MNLFLTLSKQDIALQIATLINKYNGWQITCRQHYILNSNIDYFVELNQNLVVGCVGLQYENNLNSKIIHLCVHDLYRRKGIGKKLVLSAINNCKANTINTNIRTTNFNSLCLFYKMGFLNKSLFYIGNNQMVCVSKTMAIHNNSTII